MLVLCSPCLFSVPLLLTSLYPSLQPVIHPRLRLPIDLLKLCLVLTSIAIPGKRGTLHGISCTSHWYKFSHRKCFNLKHGPLPSAQIPELAFVVHFHLLTTPSLEAE